MSIGADKELEHLRRENERLRDLVYRDELTGALNRRGALAMFEPIFKEARYAGTHRVPRRRIQITELSLIYIDFDNFKSINDTYGHGAGDAVLRALVTLLKDRVRSLDGVVRLGGEEFAVIMVGAKENESCNKGEELRVLIEGLAVPELKGERVTASIGVASIESSQANTLEELFTAADKAMYEAKHNRGKNAVVCYGEFASHHA